MTMKRAIRGGAIAVALAATAASAADVVITQKDKAFQPAEVTIHPGDTLVFKNDDPVNHNVFSETKGLDFVIKSQKPGESGNVTLTSEGTTEVRCAFHPTMKLSVTVKK
jgi:plastocyanin